MAMTLDEAMLTTRSIFGETQAAAFSDQQMKDWLSIGQRAVAAISLGYQNHTTYRATDTPSLFVEGLREYFFEGSLGGGGMALESTIRVVHIYLDGQSLPLWTPKMVNDTDPRARHGGAPQYWYYFGRAIGVSPVPSGAFLATNWTLNVLHADLPGEWVGGESVLSNGLDELPIYYALTRLMLARRQWQRAAQTYNTFLMLTRQYRLHALYRNQTALDEMLQATTRERLDTPRQPTTRELRALQGGRTR